jgi:hypothetical protein
MNGGWTSDTIGVAPEKWIRFTTGVGRNNDLNLAHFVYDNAPNARAEITAANDNPAIEIGTGSGSGEGTAHTGINNVGTSGVDTFTIINVTNGNAEVTVDRPHGWSTSYPDFGTGTVVCIFGVTEPHTINNGICRITVTAPDKFIAEDTDKVRLRFDEGFVNDGHGRVCNILDKQTVNLAVSPIDPSIHGVPQGNIPIDGERITFFLPNGVPGIPSRGLVVGNDVTNPWIAQRDITVVDSVYATLGVPGMGTVGVPNSGDVTIEVTKNGESILTSPITFPGGTNTPVTARDLKTDPTYVRAGDSLNVNVLSTGTSFPGCNATVVVNTRG